MLGDKFQLARVKDEAGNMYKGQFDQAMHFSSEAELKTYLAGVLSVAEGELSISKMDL